MEKNAFEQGLALHQSSPPSLEESRSDGADIWGAQHVSPPCCSPSPLEDGGDNGSVAVKRARHAKLRGPARLMAVVSGLLAHCPWTAEMSYRDLSNYLSGEVKELLEAEGLPDQVSELGDVLFDAFMVHALFVRDTNRAAAKAPDSSNKVNFNDPFEAAAQKIEKRTPYIPLWGDGSVARTPDEAEVMWQAAKTEEKRLRRTRS